jgi:hypothetical protein
MRFEMTHRPAEGERFRPDAFAERVGAEVTLNIGDNRETGLLVAAKVADDGSHVRLTFELREGSEIAHWINVGYDPGVFGVGGYPPPVVPADVTREYGAGNSGSGWPIPPTPPPPDEPEVTCRLAARHLRASVVDRDGVPVLLIHDEVSAVEVTPDIGSAAATAGGYERLCRAALALADHLRTLATVERSRREAAPDA